MRWVLSILRAFQCENTPSKHPIFSPFAKKCKDGFRNKLNINALHFCILQFTFVLHPLVFLRSILYSIKHEICVPIPAKPVSYVLVSKKRYSPLTTQNSNILWSSVASASSVCHKKRKAMHCAKKVKALTLSGQCFGCMS